jgi:uncharacterized protein (DUF58 family)
MKLTGEGKRFALATVLIAVAALNTGNNLIYLVFSMMLSIFALSFLILIINTRNLVITVSQQQPIFAGIPAEITVTVSNGKKWVPSYSIRVSMPEKAEAEGEAYFPILPCASDISGNIPVVYNRRGFYGYGSFFITSGFPFIFLSKRIACRVEGSIIVYPEVKEIDQVIPNAFSESHVSQLARIRKGDELALIREFRYGDDWRRIHWKASAKTSNLMVMEYASDEPRKLTVILDNLMPRDSAYFEKAVSFAASVSDFFLKEGFFVRLLTCRKVIPFGSGREHLFKILDILAVIEGRNTWECPLSSQAEQDGLSIAILNSEASPLRKFLPVSDMVIYATDL